MKNIVFVFAIYVFQSCISYKEKLARSSKTLFVKILDGSGTEGGFLRFNILGSVLQHENPVPGNEGNPIIKNFSFTNILVNDVPLSC